MTWLLLTVLVQIYSERIENYGENVVVKENSLRDTKPNGEAAAIMLRNSSFVRD